MCAAEGAVDRDAEEARAGARTVAPHAPGAHLQCREGAENQGQSVGVRPFQCWIKLFVGGCVATAAQRASSSKASFV